jgi:phosphoribosyl-ATP pyrophosphohydrolase/phosphoribosyl-AMP cyclohydrolase/histidinol dehydrogenase
MRFVVRQRGTGFCHTGTWSCFDDDWGLNKLEKTIEKRVLSAPPGSYTKRLLDDPDLLRSKLVEEAAELAEAEADQVVCEAADLFYFALVAMSRAGVDLAAVDQELDRRSRYLTRRPGDAKPNRE